MITNRFSLSRLRAWCKRRDGDLRHSLRLTVAALATFAIAEIFALPQGYWGVFTAVLVTQASVGGSVKAAADWLLSTLGGGAYAAFVGTVFPHSDRAATAVGLALVLAPLAFLAAIRPTFRFAPVTGAIIILIAPVQHLSPLDSALVRLVEISLGGVIGLAVSLFVLPARASHMLRGAAATTLEMYAELLPIFIRPDRGRHQAELTQRHDATLAQLARLTVAVEEAKRERESFLSDEPDPDPILRTLQRVRADIIMVGRATAAPLPETFHRRLLDALTPVVGAIAETLRALGASLAERRVPPSLTSLEQAIACYAHEVSEVRQAGLIRDLTSDALGRTFAVGFALEQLMGNLTDFAARTAERARKSKVPVEPTAPAET